MDPLRLLTFAATLGIAYTVIWVGTRAVLKRQRAKTAELRRGIAPQVIFATTLKAARVYQASSVGRDGYAWFSVQGPRRLVVSSDAFTFSAPNALKEYVFRGRDCSIGYSRAPSSMFVTRDWIVITGLAAERQVKIAISNDNLMHIWQALAATGAATRS